MKKLILSLGISAVLLGGSFVVKETNQSKNTNESKVLNVAAGEKEPGLFSTYRTSSSV